MPRFFAGRIPDDQWRNLPAYCLDHADAFVVHMPDGDGPLRHGRHEFRALPGSTVSAWSGMADAISIPSSPRRSGTEPSAPIRRWP